ncbi:MAG: SGNH/GDSL hydrolase family protein, partial [Candidatus Methylomirabilis sp.]|nr:SGNH/GDSL hydrolase family protein [Deltaproteobacteria bacterium]
MRAGRVGIVFAVAALLALAPEARAAKVVVFGDSWGYGGWEELGAHLAARGHPEMTVESYAVPGSSADFWANVQPNAMRDAVSLNPDAEYVWLSITGNDVFAHYAAGNGASCAADNDVNLRKMLDDFFAVHPGVKVASFGYDFVNYEQSPECILTGITIFPGFATPQVNLTLLNDVGAVMQAVDADYPNFTFVPVWGTLQAAGGIPGAPNILFPSPSQYFADCIHPNTAGFNLIMSRFYDLYW